MKVVGSKNRDEIELDPLEAWRRGAELDKLLLSTSVPHPRGVWRQSHKAMNDMDFARQVAIAARLNQSKPSI